MLRKQYPYEGGNESLYPIIEEYPQDLFFSAMESEVLGEDLNVGSDGSGEDFLEEGELLMKASPKLMICGSLLQRFLPSKVRFP